MRSFVAWVTKDPMPGSRSLRAARGLWVVFVAILTGLLVVSVAPMWREATSMGIFVEYYHTEGHYRLTPLQLNALTDIGLSASWHGALVVSRQVVLFAGSVLVAWIVWRSNQGWAAVFISWFLVAALPIGSAEVVDLGAFNVLPGVVMAAFFTSFVGLLFVLPDGRRVRMLALTVLAWSAILAVGVAVGVEDAFWVVGGSALLGALALGVIAVVSRAVLDKDPARRAVLGLTLVFALLFVPAMALADGLSGVTGPRRAGGELIQRILVESVLSALPLMFGVALVYVVVKRGLWDLELAINRTVVYGTLTTVLFASYFVLIAVVQAVSSQTFGFRDNTLALVLATGAAAVVFLPLRERLQRLVDRVFFRQRYDLERTVEGLDGRIQSRDRIDQMAGDLVTAAEEAFQPVAAELWLPVSSGGAST